MSVSNWRDKSRDVILAARREGETQGLSGKDLERFVRARYPFGERAMWPYKVWCSEFRRLMRPGVDNRGKEPVVWPFPPFREDREESIADA